MIVAAIAMLALSSSQAKSTSGKSTSDLASTSPQSKESQKAPLRPVIPLRPGDQTETIDEGGTSRSYLVHVPADYTGRLAMPMVMVLHGWTSSGKGASFYTGMARESDANRFIAVFPDGSGSPKGWNCGFFNLGAKGVDDVKFLTDVIHDVERSGRIDKNRVYVCGHSSGAFMTYDLASAIGDQIASIGIVAGTVGVDPDGKAVTIKPPKAPVSALIIHGLKDQVVWSGSSVHALLQTAIPPMKSAEFWAKAIGLKGQPTEVKETAFTSYDWRGAGGLEVKYLAVTNGTHDWPGGYSASGPETQSGVDAASLIWSFFKSHPLIKAGSKASHR